MKKTIISIIGIAVMLLAITACQPRIVWVPGLGGNNNGQTTKEPVEVSTPDEMKDELQKGNPVKLAAPMAASDFDGIPDNSEIDGNKQVISVPSDGASPNSGAWILPKGLKLSNAVIDVTSASSGSSILNRAGDEGSETPVPPFVILINSDGVELSNVKFILDDSVAGINVYQANNVKLENLTFEGSMAKAPINITDSTVVLTGSFTKGENYSSGWYKDSFVVQVNGQDGDVNEASTVTFANATGIDSVWQEEVIADGAESNPDIIGTPAANGQSQIVGLGEGYTYIFSETSTATGWMWAPVETISPSYMMLFARPAHDRFFNGINGAIKGDFGTFKVTKAPESLGATMPYSITVENYSYTTNSVNKPRATGDLTMTFTAESQTDPEGSYKSNKWALQAENLVVALTIEGATAEVVVDVALSGVFAKAANSTSMADLNPAIFTDDDGIKVTINPDDQNNENPAFCLAQGLEGTVTVNGVTITARDIMDAAAPTI